MTKEPTEYLPDDMTMLPVAETKWTLGPWEWIAPDHSVTFLAPAAEPLNAIVTVRTCSSCDKRQSNCCAPSEANARLIAAAPELYEALENLVADVADYEAWQRPCHAVNVANAALKKARGE